MARAMKAPSDRSWFQSESGGRNLKRSDSVRRPCRPSDRIARRWPAETRALSQVSLVIWGITRSDLSYRALCDSVSLGESYSSSRWSSTVSRSFFVLGV